MVDSRENWTAILSSAAKLLQTSTQNAGNAAIHCDHRPWDGVVSRATPSRQRYADLGARLVSAERRSVLGVRVTSNFAWWPSVDPLPRAAKLTRRTESGLFGNTFHVQPRLAQQFVGIRDA